MKTGKQGHGECGIYIGCADDNPYLRVPVFLCGRFAVFS